MIRQNIGGRFNMETMTENLRFRRPVIVSFFKNWKKKQKKDGNFVLAFFVGRRIPTIVGWFLARKVLRQNLIWSKKDATKRSTSKSPVVGTILTTISGFFVYWICYRANEDCIWLSGTYWGSFLPANEMLFLAVTGFQSYMKWRRTKEKVQVIAE